MGGARPFRLGCVIDRGILPLWKVWIDFSVATQEYGKDKVGLDNYGEPKALKMGGRVPRRGEVRERTKCDGNWASFFLSAGLMGPLCPGPSVLLRWFPPPQGGLRSSGERRGPRAYDSFPGLDGTQGVCYASVGPLTAPFPAGPSQQEAESCRPDLSLLVYKEVPGHRFITIFFCSGQRFCRAGPFCVCMWFFFNHLWLHESLLFSVSWLTHILRVMSETLFPMAGALSKELCLELWL